MRDYDYALTETAGRSAYGIALRIRGEGGWQTLCTVEDLSSDKEAAAQLAERCRRLQLSPVHLMDVVEDFLARD